MQFILLTLLFLVVLPYVWMHIGPAIADKTVYNADLLQPYLMVGDLIEDPTSLVDWHQPPSIYVFPDWLLSGMLLALPLSPPWLPILYGAIVMALYCMAGGAILSASGRISAALGTWVLAAILVGAGLLATVLGGMSLSSNLYVILAAPFIHTGAVLSTLIAAALFLRLLPAGNRPLLGVALALLTFAASISDRLFVVWFVAPACLAGLLCYWANRPDRSALVPVAIAMGAALAGLAVGWGLSFVLNIHAVPGHGSPERTWRLLEDTFERAADIGDVPSFLILAAALALLARGTVLTVDSLLGHRPTSGEAMEILLAGICAAALSAPLATSMMTELWLSQVGGWRYFLILTLIPMIWVAYLALGALAQSRFPNLLSYIPAAMLLGCILIALPSWHSVQQLVAVRPLQKCVEAEGRTTGLAGAWTARRLTMLSGRRLHVVAITQGGAPDLPNHNARWYAARGKDEAPPKFDFILLPAIDWNDHVYRDFEEIFGAPDRIVHCDKDPSPDRATQLWLYDSPLTLRDDEPES